MILGCRSLGLTLVLLLVQTAAQETCTMAGTPGMPGIPGLPGYDGRNGQKGEKGDPGVLMSQEQAMGQKGQKGEPGVIGKKGKIGKSGIPGPAGGPGQMGPPGEPGDHGNNKQSLVPAFSVRRYTNSKPNRGRPVVFNSAITNILQHYNIESGKFECQISGTYYFAFHTTLNKNLCASLVLNGVELAKFCDHIVSSGNPNFIQVSSGGLAVYVQKGQQVWVQTDMYNNMYAEGEQGDSVFSGFLVYAH